jgi:DNA replication protein DnaC
MKPAIKIQLLENLRFLKLAAITGSLEACLRQATESGIDYAEFLLNVTEVEVASRTENGRRRRIRLARFPLLKPIETFNFDAAKDLNFQLIKQLLTGQYLKEGRNVIFLGKSGTGKTHLATALGMEACRLGKKTLFTTACGLANELVEARQERVLSKAIKRYASCDLLVLDELGYVPFSKEAAELLFQVLAERNEKRSVVITSNMGFGDWTSIFGDPTLTAALLDRVTHNAHVISCNWESYRFKETLKKKKNPN